MKTLWMEFCSIRTRNAAHGTMAAQQIAQWNRLAFWRSAQEVA